MAFERCHDPEELPRLGSAAGFGVRTGGGYPAGGLGGGGALGGAWTAEGGMAMGGMLPGERRLMPDSYAYKVRDKSANLVSGTLVADNEAPGPPAPPRDGLRPTRGRAREEGMNIELKSQTKIKLKEIAMFSRQFATMVNSGLPILRAPLDPGRSGRTRSSQTALDLS